ncbi:tRNA (adenosine(37)-N6)-threonylcarbamoyltransferase complex dimerization subunit type 1 TsaB [Sphingomonas qomolangmaensis]|uniref:tRNA (Adenosine(37)-N6)-threonylcarbamoyltransferase complex dimerization subunit type 1 TsaB n=1 Tax=Sphingomonas qomolangmaensis TaxID=2918765 RepID=A0ABY5L6A7_9SPHN|nr:tRNA (adenosine(37)-N6)-threonylcarbamoyltransferase complex dimerization subunit type 1 TsaB [Sphingomonas qomolangmaensis]UUL81696.1 tRNA (adenosine(37)-N6)-threonylcarbamoyltransferase complex dimerization subunit type 1 TsaB [Sphingomonas qomolangmaensis]
MRILVIETATAACSVALLEDGEVASSLHEVVGRGHAERLVPMIGEVVGDTAIDAILVDCGPGSFTGIRVGIAAARGLGLGWGVPVSGYSAPAVVAAAAFAAEPSRETVAVVMEGGHGEVFVQRFAAHPFAVLERFASLAPDAALAAVGDAYVVGDGARRLLALAPELPHTVALPDAAAARLLPAAFTALAATPIYGRGPDALSIAERAARAR